MILTHLLFFFWDTIAQITKGSVIVRNSQPNNCTVADGAYTVLACAATTLSTASVMDAAQTTLAIDDDLIYTVAVSDT